MKNLLLILFVAFVGCKKESAQRTLVDSEPKIIKVEFTQVYEAGDFHPKFEVDIIADSGSITKLILYRVPLLRRWEVDYPKTGHYKMYDHITSYPTFASSTYYNFEWVKSDGTKKEESPFQVY